MLLRKKLLSELLHPPAPLFTIVQVMLESIVELPKSIVPSR